MPILLNVNVRNKIATGDGQIVVCDNSDYIVNFDFDSEWDEFDVKTMRLVFSNGEYNEVVFTGDKCALPVIQSRNGFSIGVYAGNIHTTVSAWFDCAKSILSDGEQHGEPAPDVYNQLIEMIESGMIKGDKGDPGEDGVGIETIELISTVGRVKTYRITKTDESTFEYEITDGEKGDKGDTGSTGETGNGIASVALISTVDRVKTYRITMTDGTTFDYDVTDGEKGEKGDPGSFPAVDDEMSTTSENPVQNKTITNSILSITEVIDAQYIQSNDKYASGTVGNTISLTSRTASTAKYRTRRFSVPANSMIRIATNHTGSFELSSYIFTDENYEVLNVGPTMVSGNKEYKYDYLIVPEGVSFVYVNCIYPNLSPYNQTVKIYFAKTAGDNVLSGKRVSILGDSISTFAYTSDKETHEDGKTYAKAGCTTNYPGNKVTYQMDDVTTPNLTWWGRVLDHFRMVLGINESWGGSCIGYNSSQDGGGKYTADNCMCSQTRIGHLDENGDPDIILVFGGTNDINHHLVGSGPTLRYAVGELNTTDNPYDFANFPIVTNTYYGSITTMLLRIRDSYPNATLLFVLPYCCTYTHRSSDDIATPYDEKVFHDVAKNVCEYLGVQYIDLRPVINLNNFRSLLTSDLLHPNSAGMQAIANAVIHKLSKML